jgi:hydrogenase nickel incorporation protein HypB
MCATCGCASGHDHDHDHEHDGHDHDDHAHEHPHEHPHEHTHTPGPRLIQLERDVLARNDGLAARNREWFAERGVLALNLVSSPGAGKTALLERTIRDLGSALSLVVIEGDQATARDADRIRRAGGRAVQVNTGTVCHLDAGMIGRAVAELEPRAGSIVMIENVGNLVCPALFDLGEQAKVLVASVTEGEDKPLKYPHMYRASTLMLLNKIDLVPHVAFDVERCVAYAREVNPRLEVLGTSATRGDGLREWYAWLAERLAAAAARRPQRASA